jgi:hypothetical protein
MTISETLAYIDGLMACGLPHDDLVTEIVGIIRRDHPAHTAATESLIARAPPEKLHAVIAAFLKGLAKAEKTELKRKRDRETIAIKRSRHGDTATLATSATLATPRHCDPSPAYTSPPKEVSEPKKVLKKSISRHTLPVGFNLGPGDIEFACSKGWDQQRIDSEFARFCDHYRASGARKADWHAVWRLWVTSPYQDRQPPLPLPPTLYKTNPELRGDQYGAHRNGGGFGGGGFAQNTVEFARRAGK